MPLFRKRPVEIEAIQWTGDHATLSEFMGGSHWWQVDDGSVIIGTPEDGPASQVHHYASPGDWIIRGVVGEFYPCKPNIFAATYEVV